MEMDKKQKFIDRIRALKKDNSGSTSGSKQINGSNVKGIKGKKAVVLAAVTLVGSYGIKEAIEYHRINQLITYKEKSSMGYSDKEMGIDNDIAQSIDDITQRIDYLEQQLKDGNIDNKDIEKLEEQIIKTLFAILK